MKVKHVSPASYVNPECREIVTVNIFLYYYAAIKRNNSFYMAHGSLITHIYDGQSIR